jgi:hypothetical protein
VNLLPSKRRAPLDLINEINLSELSVQEEATICFLDLVYRLKETEQQNNKKNPKGKSKAPMNNKGGKKGSKEQESNAKRANDGVYE